MSLDKPGIQLSTWGCSAIIAERELCKAQSLGLGDLSAEARKRAES